MVVFQRWSPYVNTTLEHFGINVAGKVYVYADIFLTLR